MPISPRFLSVCVNNAMSIDIKTFSLQSQESENTNKMELFQA